MEKITIHTENIQLDQLLKWAGIVESGGQVKLMLEDEIIKVNGNIETARRRCLHEGDIVEIEDVGSWQVAVEQSEA